MIELSSALSASHRAFPPREHGPAGEHAASPAAPPDAPAGRRVARTPRAGTETPGGQLGSEDRAELRKLRAQDREVRAHEQAHRAAAGNLARGTTRYEFQTGPDGVRYAIGGEVQIDTSPEGDPRATIAKAERIIAAALAPTQPSPQDRAVAAKAAALAAQARIELAREGGDAAQAAGASDAEKPESRSPFAPTAPRPEALFLDLTA